MTKVQKDLKVAKVVAVLKDQKEIMVKKVELEHKVAVEPRVVKVNKV